MKVILISPQQAPELVEIDNNLHSLQSIVDGYIEVIRPFTDSVAIVCNEEGKLYKLTPSLALVGDRDVKDVICGKCILVGVEGDEFTGLSQELCDKYLDLLKIHFCASMVDGSIPALFIDN